MAGQEFAGDGVGVPQQPGTAQPSAEGQPQRQPRVNLDDFEEFRAYKSEADRREAAIRAEAEAERQRVNQIQYELNQIRMSGMSDLEKWQFAYAESEKARHTLQQQMEQERVSAQVERDFQQIIRETGAPVQKLAQARNIHEAWAIGVAHLRQNGGTPQQTDNRHLPEDQVDTGSGRSLSAADSLQRRYDQAGKDFDVLAQLNVLDEATRRGITIKE
jgi:hypothetical protein